MSVRVEMDMPEGCKDCPYYHHGVVNELCRFGGRHYGLSSFDLEVRPDTCPLDECVRIAITVKNNPPIVTDSDDDKTAVIKMFGGTRCEECIFKDENGKCCRDCDLMEGRIAGGIGWCSAGIKKEE